MKLRDRAGQRADRVERLPVDPRRFELGRLDANGRRARAVEPLGPFEQCGVAAVAHVGDDLRRPRQQVEQVGSPHGSSLSTGMTRMSEAPAAFSGGSRFQISSASTGPQDPFS